MAIRADIPPSEEWFTGEDRVLEFTIYQADGTTPQDISGWELSWFLKRSKKDADSAAVLAKTNDGSPSDVTIVDGPAGRVDVLINADDTLDLVARVYRHELKRMDTGEKTIESYGDATLQQALHRDA